MGWFDKKSWQLRRKIRDLQSELAAAEREGKYVVCQGLFFAELAEMGNETMLVLGKADTIDTEEEQVIRSFFERNGFSVAALRLEKDHKALSLVEILPPEEFTKRVALDLKKNDFKLVDDSEHERPSRFDEKVITLSSLLRTISALFAGHVHSLIVSTPIKMNMEGNRLLHWMPLIRDSLLPRVPADLVVQCRQPFIDAYNHYYGRFGQMESTTGLDLVNSHPADDHTEDFHFTDDAQAKDKESWSNIAEAPSQTLQSAQAVRKSSGSMAPVAPEDLTRALASTHLLAKIYKSLIGASEQRKVKNCEAVLDYIARFFNAQSASLMALESGSNEATVIAASTEIGSGFTNRGLEVDQNTIVQSLREKAIVHATQTNGDGNPTLISGSIANSENAEIALCIIRPANYQTSDNTAIEQFIQVFREFPELVIPQISEKV